jgi:hypothetical protein
MLVMLVAGVLSHCVSPSAAQCNPACQGDFNLDQEVTVDEIIVAVNNALGSCEPSLEQQGCLASGGTVSTGLCCSAAPEFPDTCAIGTCGCAPQFSREVSMCECGEGRCFDRQQRACVSIF